MDGRKEGEQQLDQDNDVPFLSHKAHGDHANQGFQLDQARVSFARGAA